MLEVRQSGKFSALGVVHPHLDLWPGNSELWPTERHLISTT